ncbi:EscU/YscU/HrcU family type III secretion system export apparatus switch protein [Paeniglutamicibacter sulfureus]|uniref:EscU/YscU/HrcU family type III secretion system export apparatus switch protein n=1 Tax=Paeniglutamicibacter sulfureus TaxID=43666 RepID=UPI0026670C07|nr:EscU/YscU/HrcU family type III secretion system export apparatus switch protein [Paeniglutamicibacter sulfureus]MDO2935599.1 EscU/YscU/HrcU family type III secretion system export apparatus switch protein [Paeniglutamicibacter sulfureus]
MSQDSGERSEKATAQRMKEVHEKGKMTRSQDLAAWLGIGAAALMLPGVLVAAETAGRAQLEAVRGIIAAPDPEAAVDALGTGLGSLSGTLLPLFVVVLVVVVVIAALQGGINFKKFKLDPANLNLVTGVQRVFGLQALWQGLKALLKVAVIGLVLWFVVASLMPLLLQSGSLSLSSLLAAGSDGASSLIRASVIAGLVLAAIDVLVVMRRNRKHTRMTRKEVTDENKRTDGDPLIKSQRRSRQMAMSRNRMIAAIADADVVVVNPTHVAVALRYEPGKSAPRLVAKGAGNIATRIREEAAEKSVPMVRDIPLARSLHEVCEIGDEIPADSYNDVARVLAFVMALKARGNAAGVHTVPVAATASANPGPGRRAGT